MNARERNRLQKRHDNLVAELKKTSSQTSEDEGHRRQRELRAEALRLAIALREAK